MLSPPRKPSRPRRKPAVSSRGRVDATFSYVRDRIVSGELSPGVSIIDAHVARDFGVSRATVRIALHRLQQEGYLVASSLGTYSRLTVTPIRKRDAWELGCIIGEIEGRAAQWAAELERPARQALVADLREINEALGAEGKGRRRDPDRVFKLDTAFHRRYVEIPPCQRLLTLHASIKPQWERYGRAHFAAIIEQLNISVREHNTVIQAIAAGDPEAAHTAVRMTWRNGATRLIEHVLAFDPRLLA